MIDIRHAAQLLSGEVSGRQILCPGPGHSRADRSLSVRFDPAAPGGFVVHSFAEDDPIGARDFVRNKLGLPPWQPGDEQDRRVHPSHRQSFDRAAVDREAERRPRTEEEIARIGMATKLWNEGIEPRRTAAERYLRSRALELTADLAGPVLRFHPRCPWRNDDAGRTDRIPALLAAFRSIDDDEITAVHRIRLDQPERWPKADRRMLGIVHRAAVKLDNLSGGTLVIGEGVETCSAARQMGLRPVWALGSVGSISIFPVIKSIKHLIILGERDKANADAIKFCSRRWQQAWRRVEIAYPETGKDLNDALMAQFQVAL
jgi:putative DNA primase/helicase